MESEIKFTFSHHKADILPKYSIHGLVTLVKYQLDWKKIVDFLLLS